MSITTLEHTDLAPALKAASLAVEKKISSSVLSHILLEVTPEQAVISATNLDRAFTATIPAHTVSPGRYALPAEVTTNFAQACRAEITLSWDQAGRCKITSGGSEITVPVMPADTFPDFASAPLRWFRCEGAQWSQWVSRTTPFAAKEEARGVLQNLLLRVTPDEKRGELLLVATDTHQLSKVTSCVEMASGVRSEPRSVLLPPASAAHVASIMGSASEIITFCDGQTLAFEAQMEWGVSRYTSRLVVGQFPPFEKLFANTQEPIWLEIEASAWAGAIQRCSLVGPSEDDGTRRITLAIHDESVTITGSNKDRSQQSREEVPLKRDEPGEELPFAFYAHQMPNVLKACPEPTLRLAYRGQTQSIQLFPASGDKGSAFVVAPVI